MNTPSLARSSGSSSNRFLPSYNTYPETTSYDGCPAKTFDKVDLPEPFGPMIAWTSPLLTCRLRPFKISLPSMPACKFLTSNNILLFPFYQFIHFEPRHAVPLVRCRIADPFV